MFKGIHNEAEFYTNFYFDNKLSSDLQSKVATFSDIKDKTDKLKGLESFYWAYRDAKPSNESLLEFYQKLLTVLGYQFDLKAVDTLKETSFNSIAQVQADDRTNLYVFLANEIEEGTFETAPLTINIAENPETRELSEVISEYFDELENPPKWILVGSSTTMFLLERNKWAFGKYIKFNWDEIFQQKTDDLFSSILGLISKESLCPASGQSIHAEMDDNSHRHAFEVTTELRESVRESIELLINEMIYQKKEKHQAYLTKDSSLYAKELSHDALFYAYRLIFLLFLEAQAEDSELLPLKSEIYRHGYSLEKLLELIHDIPDEKTADFEGTFVFESLQQIFSLIYNGFDYKVERDLLTDTAITNSGFLLKGIKSDLFSPEAVKHLKDIKLRNGVMLTVLRKLSLSSTGKGKNKRLTRVSYSNLGINQLGAVYEGLLSYSGFFAQEDLHALKPASVKQSDIDNGKELDQIYLAPKSIVDKYSSPKEKKYKLSQDNFVLDENGNPKIYKKGSFVYRLAGRDRQKLASFYTPESLTKCTVKYSLKVLFENKKTLADLWSVKILEPAMGSGAFLNEAVNQIADRILELEVQEKVRDLKTPKEKQKRLWEIKYDIISKNVYGVDLNPTAIELARFSLWLNCIGAGKEPPQFDGRLKIGNSLIGARFKKGADGIYPWLLLDDGMMNYGKRLKDFDGDKFEVIQTFRKGFFSSRLESYNEKIKALQLKAESVFKLLIDSKDETVKRAYYERLKLCCDLWCAAFVLTEDDLINYPSNHNALCDHFYSILENGTIDPKLKTIAEAKYSSERFFHWELEYPDAINAGGFDLILGNPPWVAVEWQDALFISDFNVIPVICELSAPETRSFIDSNDDLELKAYLFKQYISIQGYSNFLETDIYSVLRGVPKNTYKAFNVIAFDYCSNTGSIGLIHEDGILEDKNATELRKIFYNKYKFHFQFQNEKHLFSEVHNQKKYSVNIFTGEARADVGFFHIGNIFHPQTIEISFADEDVGKPIPTFKDNNGNWSVDGHKLRIVHVTGETLKIFSKFLNDDQDSPRFLNLHSSAQFGVVNKIASCEETFQSFAGEDKCIGSQMLNETIDQDNGNMKKVCGRPTKLDDLVLSGPHIGTFNPYFQEVKEPYTSSRSYQQVDLTKIDGVFHPKTIYQLQVPPRSIDEKMPTLNGSTYRSFYRIVSRGMVHPSNERCLFTCIIPPKVFHINGLRSLAFTDLKTLIYCAGLSGSLLYDSMLRILGKTNFFPEDFKAFPFPSSKHYLNSIARRTVVLNCITEHYSSLWEEVDYLKVEPDSLLDGTKLGGFGEKFDIRNGIRKSEVREQATVEIEALTALSFNLEEHEMHQVYDVFFTVLQANDNSNNFDRRNKMSEAYRFFSRRGW